MGFWSRLARTVRRDRHDRDIDEEIAFHLAMRQQDGADARSARLRFGNPASIREQVRAAGSLPWLESSLQDVRYGLRQLRRTPLVTAAVLASLVIGIGANTAIFTLVDAALLKSLPVKDPRSLVLVEWTSQGWPDALATSHTGDTNGVETGRMRGSSVAPTLHRRLAREQEAVASLMGFSDANAVGLVVDGQPAREVNLQYVSANFFEDLGIAPARGRLFVQDDDVVGRPLAVVLSHRLWHRDLARRDDIIGRTIRVNGVTATIAGIAPPGFFGLEVGEWVDVYAPLAARVALTPPPAADAPRAEQDDYWWVRQMARLRPGTEPDAAVRQLTILFKRLVVPDSVTLDARLVPDLVWSPGSRGFRPAGQEVSTALWTLLLLVGLILLIVCANVANLLLARAVVRHRESAVRLALGASTGRLLRQHLLESALLAMSGGALGLWVGYLLAGSIQPLLAPGTSTSALDLSIDGRMLAFTAGTSVLTALLFGLAPSVRYAHADLNQGLKAGSRAIVPGHLRLPRVLVAGQVALCLAVLVAAGLLGQSLVNLQSMDLGFDRTNIVYATVNPWRAGMPAAHVGPYIERLRQELARLPGVQQVATIASRPLSGSASAAPARIPGRPFRDDGSDLVLLNELGEGSLETLGIPVVAGRSLDARDMRAGADGVLVDERFVRRFFPDRYPLGQRFGLGREGGVQFEIVGVVRSSRYNSLRSDLRPTFYRPYHPAEDSGRDVHFVIRAGVAISQLANPILRVAAAVNADVPVTELVTQSALVDRMLRAERLLGLASAAFSVMALLLAAVGIGGLLAYAVTRRSTEIGVRMAMGARPADIGRMVLRESLWLVGAGVLVGVPAAAAVARLLQTTLFGVEATDIRTAAGSLAVLVAVALLAAWVPARRAAAVQPMAALRQE